MTTKVDDCIDVWIGEDGGVQCIYSDDVAILFETGEAIVARASHVEPHARGGWFADMSPVGGPVLGKNGAIGDVDVTWNDVEPFKTRAEALAAEVAWLRAEMARRSLVIE